ncbi:MAG: hypothetical protein K9W44_17775 [Candidatus Lokiarchaeota archaeon]|nr:hypothetical protein [Candidatus Harpocratesius repetitus]
MKSIEYLYHKLQDKNLLTAILLIDVIFTLFFFLNPFMIYLTGDLDFLLSILTGMIYITKNRKETQNGYLLFFETGILGGFVTAISAIVITMIKHIYELNTNFGEIYVIFILLGQFIGLFLAIFSSILHYFNFRDID